MTKKNTFSNKTSEVLFSVARQICYFLVIIAEVFVLSYLASIYREKTFAENFIVEKIQLALLILSALTFLYCGITAKGQGHLSFIFAGTCAFAAVRECDKFFDDILPFISWKFAYIFPLLAIAYGILHKNLLKQQIIDFLQTPTFNMMCIVMIIVVPIAQCVGHRPFVRSIVGDANVAKVKEFFEECLETIGYTMLLLSSLEYCFNSKIKSK